MLAAVESGDAKELAELIRQDPGFDVNKVLDKDRNTLLHYACGENENDRRSPVIPLLLAHPDINVNVEDIYGNAPFYLACVGGNTSCIREMLKDSRVKVNEPHTSGFTPLWWAARNGSFDAMKWWIACGREMHLGTPGDVDNTDAIGVARKERRKKVVTLLERFKENPDETRHAMRVEIGWHEILAAEMFALVVFVSDGLLQINDTTTPSPAARFFKIAGRLPIELQMMLCFRQVGSDKEIISGKESKAAFKKLARILW